MSLRRRGFVGAAVATMALARAGWTQQRALVDSVGRHVRVPDRAKRVMAAGPPASVLLYALAPEAMVGWIPVPPAEAKPYLLPSVRGLAANMRLTGEGEALDLDGIKTLRADLILDFGSTAAGYVRLAERVQTETGIPYALIDGSIGHLPAALRLAGDMLGRRERAEALAAYAEKSLSLVDDAMKSVPAGRRPRVYVARGNDGLLTAVRGSGLVETVERAGGATVAEGRAGLGGGLTVSFEQIAAWKPDIIIAFDHASFDATRRRPEWSAVTAGKRVVAAPTLPWGWLGEPPSINRLIGLRWLSLVLYPDRVLMDLASEARDFHRLFYGTAPTDAELTSLLDGAV